MLNFKIGSIVRVTATFTDPDSEMTIDPATVLFSYKPDATGVATTLTYGTDTEVVRSEQGVYYVDLDTTSTGGNWRWRFWSTGTGADAFEDTFYVKPNPVVATVVGLTGVDITASGGSDIVGYLPPGTGAVARTVQDKLRESITFEDFGANGNGLRVGDATMSAVSTTLTSATGGFTTAMVGMDVVVEGASTDYATLITTVASVESGTSLTLAAPSVLAVSGVQAFLAFDDTDAIEAAIVYAVASGVYRIEAPGRCYGFTTIRLRQAIQITGAGNDVTTFARMGLGAGGPAIAMTAGQLAQKVRLTEFSVHCNQIGTHGLALGIEGNAYAYANGSFTNNVKVYSAPQFGAYFNSNVGNVGQLWVQNTAGLGTPTALSIPLSGGIKTENTTFKGDLISVEGHYEAGDAVLNAGGISRIAALQLQPTGTYASSDLVSFGNSGQVVESMYIATGGATRRDVVRILTGVQAIQVYSLFADPNFPITATNTINDVQNSVTLAYNSNHKYLPFYLTDTGNHPFYNDQLTFTPGLPMVAVSMTGTVRDALTPANGWIIYNTSTNKLQVRANGSWVDLH